MTILRYWFLGLAVLIAAVIGWRSASPLRSPGHQPAEPVAVQAGTPPVPASQNASSRPAEGSPEARAEIVQRLNEVPQFAGFYKALSAAFPHLYENLINHAAQALGPGGTVPSSGTLLWEALRDLQQTNGILAANADEAALATFFEARLSILDVLATADPRTCADFLYGATDPAIESFAVAHRDLVAEMAMKQLAVIEDGQRRRLKPGAPSSEDLDLVAGGLAAKKLSADEIALLLDGASIDPPLPDSRLCELGRIYLSVLKDLPHAVRQRVYGLAAELLARS